MDALTDKLLGGARRRRTRVRGFAPWRPAPDTLALLDLIRAALIEYAAYLPLMLGQVFYWLVGAHGYEKTERAYQRLGETLSRARRARLISMDDIRDGGGDQRRPQSWSGAEQFLGITRWRAKHLRLDRSMGQTTRLAVLCEASGMVPQLANIALNYDVPVFSSGGFESVTEEYNFATEIAADRRPTEVMQIGDHDPSGAVIFLASAEDVTAFAAELGGNCQQHPRRQPTAARSPPLRARPRRSHRTCSLTFCATRSTAASITPRIRRRGPSRHRRRSSQSRLLKLSAQRGVHRNGTPATSSKRQSNRRIDYNEYTNQYRQTAVDYGNACFAARC